VKKRRKNREQGDKKSIGTRTGDNGCVEKVVCDENTVGPQRNRIEIKREEIRKHNGEGGHRGVENANRELRKPVRNTQGL